MAIQVGINGFGRIGRITLRSMIERGSHSCHIAGINLRNAEYIIESTGAYLTQETASEYPRQMYLLLT